MKKPLSKKLAAAIARENRAEDAGMHADDRTTCYPHQDWAENCEGRHVRPTAESLLAEHNEIERRRNRT
ncbi:hypothetical protein [Kitasatospora sp. NPDC090091]|uniref:hypothetical protein n=1 Tax=Kitasatospora sp. NPDC090091 TaxID=3364081 RepID=UPI0037FCE7FC